MADDASTTPRGAEDLAADEQIVAIASALLARGGDAAFAYEGILRHALRSALCEMAWRWSSADAAAALVVRAAFRKLKVRRPTFREAQPIEVKFDFTED